MDTNKPSFLDVVTPLNWVALVLGIVAFGWFFGVVYAIIFTVVWVGVMAARTHNKRKQRDT